MEKIDTIYLHLTRQCNLRCSYCYFDAGHQEFDELCTDDLVGIINTLHDIKPRRIVFTGGEPLLRKDIFDLAFRIKAIDNDIIIGITTNGLLINPSNAKDLVKCFNEIRISIDGPKEVNDALRGRHSFDQAMLAFEYILNAGGNPAAFITATSHNIDHLKGFMKYLLLHGISKIHISPLKIVGRATDDDLLCDPEALRKTVEEFYFKQFGLRMESVSTESFNCGVGKYISINPDGSVYPCHVLSFPELCIGNVKNESLSSIFFNSKLMNDLRNLEFDEISQCAACFLGLSAQSSCLGVHVQDSYNRSQLVDFMKNSKQ